MKIFGASFALLLLSVACSGSPSATPAAVQPSTSERSATTVQFESWRSMMERLPKPDDACLTASYPAIQWRQVRCAAAPGTPLLPVNGITHATVGDGTDFSAVVTGYANFAEGGFSAVDGVKSEYAAKRKHHHPNVYSLQLNTQFFTTKSCTTLGSPDPQKCSGWEQFAYDTGPPVGVFIEYWLVDFGPFGTPCPSGWHRLSDKTYNLVDCWINSKLLPAPIEPITELKKLRVVGAAAYDSRSQDFAELIVGYGSLYYVPGQNWFPDLQSEWQTAEFNVFGDCCGDQASFNAGSTIDVRTEIDSGTTSAPTCDTEGFTAESNNLFLSATPTMWPQTQYPSIVFAETNDANHKKATCIPEGS